MTYSVKKNRQQGATMIEILVTLFVMAIGILGMVGLQYNSLKNGSNAQYRYQATLLAYDMAERMRSNPTGVEAGRYDAITKLTTESDQGSPITAGNLYKQDIFEWKTNLASLPNGNGEVTANGDAFTIRIEWSQLEGQGTGAATESLIIEVRI
jgi:type IV pilus assembly protein PilV